MYVPPNSTERPDGLADFDLARMVEASSNEFFSVIIQ